MALIVGVGGFLGAGEKDVAVPFEAVHPTMKDKKWWLVMNTTKDSLKSAAGFKYDSEHDYVGAGQALTASEGHLLTEGPRKMRDPAYPWILFLKPVSPCIKRRRRSAPHSPRPIGRP